VTTRSHCQPIRPSQRYLSLPVDHAESVSKRARGREKETTLVKIPTTKHFFADSRCGPRSKNHKQLRNISSWAEQNDLSKKDALGHVSGNTPYFPSLLGSYTQPIARRTSKPGWEKRRIKDSFGLHRRNMMGREQHVRTQHIQMKSLTKLDWVIH
jgi:hypothetical protein